MNIKAKQMLFPLIFFPVLLLYLKISNNPSETLATLNQNPHPFMNDESNTYCGECHAEDPSTITSYKDVNLKRGVTASCLRGSDGINGIECHSTEKLGLSHPVDCDPKEDMEIPEDLHLDEKAQISCATCHDPHGDWSSTVPMVARKTKISGTNVYRSYFLRRTNIYSTLCITCHKDK